MARFQNSARENSIVSRPITLGATMALAMLLAMSAGSAQTIGRPKLPVVGKIGSNGPTHGAFTGVVQSVDRKQKVLEVGSADGANIAIFPISKKVKVSSIEGQKLKLAALAPGQNVIVSYEQQGARRTVQEITVLPKAAKGKS